MNNEQADEYGVTFDYEGTLDAVRSNQSDYLAVVNASSAVDKDLIASSINYFYNNTKIQKLAEGLHSKIGQSISVILPFPQKAG